MRSERSLFIFGEDLILGTFFELLCQDAIKILYFRCNIALSLEFAAVLPIGAQLQFNQILISCKDTFAMLLLQYLRHELAQHSCLRQFLV